jgi:signal transduction histidine kinase
MPDMDGVEAAHHINELCPTPIVVLTAYEAPDLLEQTSSAGVGAYLIKPSNTLELERAITISRARFSDLLKMRDLNQELQSRNEELAAFSHTVSHDIQNLLQLVNGFAEALYNYYDTMTQDDLKICVSSIMKNVGKMSTITRELLLLSEVRKVRAMLRPMTDMTDIVESAKQRLMGLIAEHHPIMRFPETWPVAMGHGPWVEEIWLNLLSNAIIYGGENPEIELGAEEQADDMIRFWVRDHGPGLAPKEQARLFQPFDDITQVKLEGNGLGLSITRRIVEKLNGHIGVESEVGEGCLFFFKLPSAGTL